MRKNIVTAILLLLLAGLFLTPIMPALAEGAIARIHITGVDHSVFPEIIVTAIIRDENNDPVPSSDLNPDQGNIELLESGQPVDYSFQQIATGVETMIVVDTETNSEDTKAIIQELVDAMKTDDSIGIILSTSQGNEYIRPLTKDKQAIQQVIEGLNLSSTGKRLTDFSGVQLAYDELEKSLNYQELVQSVVWISSGLHSVQTEDIADVTSKAKEINAPLHVVSEVAGTFTANQMVKLTEDVGGIFVDNSSGSLSPLLGWLDKQRVQYQFTYRSTQSDSSDRSIELCTKSGNTNDVDSYRVEVLPPQVVIDSPPNNVEYIREADTYEIGQTGMDGVEPTTVNVQAHIEWPDGYPRVIEQAQFYLDNEPTGSPIPYPGEKFSFSWDLRQYRTEGANPAQLRVDVQDELGLEGSDLVAAKVSVIIPDPPISVPISQEIKDICADYEGFDLTKCQVSTYASTMFSEPSGWIAIISLTVAIVAVVFSIRFKGQIAQGAGVVYENVRETITRLTRAGGSEVGAYLEVLRGDVYLTGQSIPLYLRTVTPAGRDPQQSELVFQANEERSIISRKHCEFREDEGVFHIRDVGSAHGTYVNGIRLPEGGDGQELVDGDKIEIGSAARGGVLLQFKLNAEQSLAADDPYDDENKYDTNPAYADDDDYDNY